MPLPQVNAIAIVRLSSLGDVILTLPVVRALRRRFPAARIYYLTTAAYQDIIRSEPSIDEVISIDSYHGLGWLGSLVYALRKLLPIKPDLLVDLHFGGWSYLHAGVWLYLVRVLTGARRSVKVFRPSFAKVRSLRASPKHVLKHYQEALKETGIDTIEPHLMHIEASLAGWAEGFLEKHGLGSAGFIAVAPGASWQDKQWGEENFRYVCNRLAQITAAKFLVFAQESDRRLAEHVLGAMPPGRGAAVVGYPLVRVAALLARSGVLLTNDSGLMHCAAFLGVPVVAVFGPTHPRLGYTPVGRGHTVFSPEISCSPCSRWGERPCRLKTRECFGQTNPQMVAEAVAKYIKADEFAVV